MLFCSFIFGAARGYPIIATHVGQFLEQVQSFDLAVAIDQYVIFFNRRQGNIVGELVSKQVMLALVGLHFDYGRGEACFLGKVSTAQLVIQLGFGRFFGVYRHCHLIHFGLTKQVGPADRCGLLLKSGISLSIILHAHYGIALYCHSLLRCRVNMPEG